MAVKYENNIKESAKDYMKSLGENILKGAADLLSNRDFISRTIGMNTSYDDIMFLVQSLGRKPVSLLGKDYLFIFDHVRRNYRTGTDETSMMFSDNDYCNKFTFYNERPTVRFANPYYDNMNLLDRWVADMTFNNNLAQGSIMVYAESDDDTTNNRSFSRTDANLGVRFGGSISYSTVNTTCDLIAKTNSNFNHGKYRTLISRFHTNSQDSKDKNDITQTAISQYGMSHGRNLLRRVQNHYDDGYHNPYCRVWTNHYQYSRLLDTIRPFGDANTQEGIERLEILGEEQNTVGFRTTGSSELDFEGGSKRLDKYGVLNRNGFVNIAPTAKLSDYFIKKANDDEKTPIKKCMFSIENLAWKNENITPNEYDQFGLSPEQKGPLGGRIMWFPPYDLSFSEDVRVNWNPNQFIGRGENVYTYTNTERTGNLSFTLLIDHPSILDYWSGSERNGLKGRYGYLKPGNTGGVDEINNQENTLLRFFAGCDILTATPQKYFIGDKEKNSGDDGKDKKDDSGVKTNPEEADVHSSTIEKKVIHCVLYYPNNYSGINDINGAVNPIYYLMNGVGTQKYVNDNNDAADIPTTIDYFVSVEGHNEFKGGYEVRKSDMGISVVTNPLEAKYETIKETYVDTVSPVRKAQRLTDKDGKKIFAHYMASDPYENGSSVGLRSYELAKIVGSEALSLGNAKGANITNSPYEWYRRRWYYRIDKAYENQCFTKKESYLDTNSNGLNGDAGYREVLSKTSIAKVFGLDDKDENTTFISFADIFVALEGSKANTILKGCFNKENVSLIRDIKENKDNKYNITKIRFEGHASFQGYKEENEKLAKNRALTLKNWMSKNNFPEIEDNSEPEIKTEDENSNVDKGENSILSTKLWRSASVIIEYEESQILDAHSAEPEEFEEKDGKTLQKTVKMEIPNGENSKLFSVPVWTPPQPWENAYMDSDKFQLKNDIEWKKRFGQDYYQEAMEWDEKYGKGAKEKYELDKKLKIGNGTNTGIVERYDNEGEFFEHLRDDIPFLHNQITQKIKYFDPAYHSISPEGFNARLTFLHQCTRQGSTVGASDETGMAYNLAFGRPPVCVLRLGDFYYTKIIISSISIQYENAQWDLNPEGIGVMPMFAKVNLNFTFLGGSDLGGPIARLQNAVSFNYYANTSVYDNRSEMVEYDSNGSGRENKFKPYSYPNMVHQRGLPKKLSGAHEWIDGTTTKLEK